MNTQLIIEFAKQIPVAVLTGLLTFLASLWKSRQDNKRWQKDFELKEKELEHKYELVRSKYINILLKKRLETYPDLVAITQDIGKVKSSYEDHKKAEEEIKKWIIAPHGGFLVLSPKTLDYFRKLKKLLKKNAGDGKSYSSDQLSKIFKTRNDLRGSMSDDLGIMAKSDLY